MLYEEIRQRYGSHIAKRVQRELNQNEFNSLKVDDLHDYLESRAEKVGHDYRVIMANPFERGNVRSEVLQSRWREAEDLVYLLSVAEDVSLAVRESLKNADSNLSF